MTTRDEYYVFQDNYYTLKELATMLRNNEVSDQILVDYITTNNIDVNSYLTTFQNGTYVPIVYQCSLLPNRVKLFKWLTSRGANTRLVVDGPTDKIYDILFSCNDKYLKHLVKHNKTLSKSIDTSRQIRTKLVHGNYRRVFLLNKLSVISEDDIRNALKCKGHDMLVLETIKTMIDRLGLICRTHNSKEEVDQVIDKYLIVFGTYIKYLPGLIIPDSAVNLLIKYYQHKILSLLSGSNKLTETMVTPVYHTDMNPKIVAVLRLLFNDRNYAETCDILDIEPASRCY